MPPPADGHRRRFARQLREAALRATATELVDLELVERLVRLNAMSVVDASDLLRALLRAQHERRAA
jgi:hypothetical protein